MTDTVSHALLDEWGLNAITYQVLGLAQKPIDWRDQDTLARLKKISGNPAVSLRKLVDRGLLFGPSRKQSITKLPFMVTDKAVVLLNKIERGLHHVDWLSAGKIGVLADLAAGPLTEAQMKERKHHRMSILSLQNANYIEQLTDRSRPL